MRKFLVLGVVAAFVLAACGNKSNNTNGPAAGGGPGQGVAPLTVNTGTVSSLGTVLVNGNGLTLYHWKGETTSGLQCTGGCLSTWLPVTASGSPTGGTMVTGKLASFSRSDTGSSQVSYNGMPLYTYTGDSKSGQANGQGLGGVWFAVTPSMSATTTGSKSSGGNNNGNGYGNGYGGGYGNP